MNETLLELPDRVESGEGSHWLLWLLRLVILAIIVWFQPDGIIGWLTEFGWFFWSIFIVVAIYANLQLFYYFYFAKWLSSEIALMTVRALAKNEEFKKDLEFVEKIQSDMKSKGILSKVNKDYIAKRFHEILKKYHREFEIAREGSLISTFVLAATPITGARSLPALGFGVAHMRTFLCALMAGNTIRIFYMAGVWTTLKKLLGSNFKYALLSFYAILILAFVFKKFILPRPKKKQSPE